MSKETGSINSNSAKKKRGLICLKMLNSSLDILIYDTRIHILISLLGNDTLSVGTLIKDLHEHNFSQYFFFSRKL